MYRIMMIAFAACLTFAFASSATASKIPRISLKELHQRSTHIVLGRVVAVAANGNLDKVTVEIGAFVKGFSKKTTFQIRLIPRGMKGFDPALKVGDNGVFFLGSLKDGKATKAYWGSISIFPKPNFH